MTRRVDHRKGSRKALERRVDGLTEATDAVGRLVRAATMLTVNVTTLVLKVSALAAVVGGFWVVEPPAAGLPAACDDEILLHRHLSPTVAANELFWQAHPEVDRREILAHEEAFSQEWWVYYSKVVACRESGASSQ